MCIEIGFSYSSLYERARKKSRASAKHAGGGGGGGVCERSEKIEGCEQSSF